MSSMQEAQFELKQNPCRRDCPDRSPKCHGACEKYAEYRHNRDIINVEKRHQGEARGYIAEAVLRNKKGLSGKYKGKDYEE